MRLCEWVYVLHYANGFGAIFGALMSFVVAVLYVALRSCAVVVSNGVDGLNYGLEYVWMGNDDDDNDVDRAAES